MLHLLLSLLITGLASENSAGSKIDPALTKNIERQTACAVISFRSANSDDVIKEFKNGRTSYSTREERLNAFHKALQTHADQVQGKTLAQITEQAAKKPPTNGTYDVLQLWINNQLIIRNLDKALLEALSTNDDILSIDQEKTFTLIDRSHRNVDNVRAVRVPGHKLWGLKNIQVPVAWSKGFTGEGAVVGIIDGGVRATHEALRDGYRTPYGWYEPRYHAPIPVDVNGHGTMSAGVAVGRNNIGVAPKAKWIACKGINKHDFVESDFLECAQWMICPTDELGHNPNCAMAAHVVHNNWSVSKDLANQVQDVVNKWLAAEIIPVFAAGDNGSDCSTVTYPSENPSLISVGAYSQNNAVSSFSARGPSITNTSGKKPDVIAPGSDIVTSTHKTDISYAMHSSTNLAAAHVAGLAALYISKVLREGGKVSYETFRSTLTLSALPDKIEDEGNGHNTVCGNSTANDYPNNQAGFGRINALTFFLQQPFSAANTLSHHQLHFLQLLAFSLGVFDYFVLCMYMSHGK